LRSDFRWIDDILVVMMFNDLSESKLANIEFAVGLHDYSFFHDFEEIIRLLSPVKTKVPLIRIGANGDGGYVAAQINVSTRRAISIGLGHEVSAEEFLLQNSFSLIAADGSVDNPFPGHSRFRFSKSHIGDSTKSSFNEITFKQFLSNHEWNCNVEIIKIDIEGAEYKLLSSSIGEISKSRQIIIEFHGFELLGESIFRKTLIDLFKEICKSHKPIHIHGNNGGPGIRMSGGEWPTLLEVTFLRNDDCLSERNYGPFPSDLDFPNTLHRPDVNLTVFFGEFPNFMELQRNIISRLK
jgi:Methyltransferase FkbM domain